MAHETRAMNPPAPAPLSRRHCLGALISLAGAPGARAAAWPSRTVRLLVPFPVGGTADVVARLLAERLAASLGQPVIVDPKPGANGIIASDAVAKAAPDGHSLLLVSAAHASNASLYTRMPYDSGRDFVPVALVAPPGPMVIAVHAGLPVHSLRELIQYAKAHPGDLAYGSAGIGNILHLAGEMLGQMAGIKLLHVPYKGAAPALSDLAGGLLQMMFNSALAVATFVKEGRLRLIAQTGLKRSPALPDLPTVAESGLPGFEVTGWFGLLAPARTPADVVQRLNGEVNRVMALPELRDKLALLGSSEAPTLSPDGFAGFLKSETQRYALVIKAAGLSLDAPT